MTTTIDNYNIHSKYKLCFFSLFYFWEQYIHKMMLVKCNFRGICFWSHGVWFFMLLKYNGFLMMFPKIMGIYECSLLWCLFWRSVRGILIWKMCSFTKLIESILHNSWACVLLQLLQWKISARTPVCGSMQRQIRT